MLLPGDPAPTFVADTSVNPKFRLDASAGRYIFLCLFGSAGTPHMASVLAGIDARHERFDVTNAVLLAVSIDPADRAALAQRWPGIIYVWDTNRAISRYYDALSDTPSAEAQSTTEYRPRTVVLDQALRVLHVIPFDSSWPRSAHIDQLLAVLDTLPALDTLDLPVPVLAVPNAFEAPLCQQLKEYYLTQGGQQSGFMREIGGKTVPVMDPSFKQRSDCEITDEQLIRTTQERISRRILPTIRQVYQFAANRIERHIVACYDAADNAHFKAHRDNTTRGTAHRRFAVSINLNADEYEGGELWFPEFSPRRFKLPTGSALIFSCSLLHEVTPVKTGRRFAFLPFLYDDAAAAVRERNLQYIKKVPDELPAPVSPGDQ